MKSTGHSIWTCYLMTRFFIGFVDMGTDLVQAARLFHASHPIWGSLTVLFPLMGFFAACLSVVIGRVRRGDPMPCKKYILLTIVSLMAVFEAFFESGPQLVLQLTVIWRGVLLEDMLIVFNEEHLGSTQWVFGFLSMLALLSSFLSLIITTMYYNEEKLRSERPSKFFIGLALTIISIVYRVFICSILFAVTPFWILGIGLATYIINVTIFKATGHSWECLLYSYMSLLCPSGYCKNQGQTSTSFLRIGSGPRVAISEVERARINQESLLKRVYVSHVTFCAINVLLLAVFVALVETKLFVLPEEEINVIHIVTRREFIYPIPCGLLLISALLTWLYIREVRAYRDFARHWDAITPKNLRTGARNGGIVSVAGTPNRFNSKLRPSAPPLAPAVTSSTVYEQQLPLNPTAYIEVIHDDETASRPRSPISANFPKPGNSKCDNETCVTCDFLVEGTTFRSTMTGKDYRFVTSVSCNARNVIYLVTCSKCRKQYVGKTEQELRQRHYGHRREIEIQSTPLGKHFADGCGYSSWRFQIIDQGAASELQRREGYWQHELMTLQPWGLNIRDEANGAAGVSTA